MVEWRGGSHWHERAVPVLIRLDLKYGGLSDSGVSKPEPNRRRLSEQEAWQERAVKQWRIYQSYLKQRYNLPETWTSTSSLPSDDYPETFALALEGKVFMFK